MSDATPSRALALLQVVIGGLRDSVRHVKYPDEELCARCGSKWPCPNGAVDELRDELGRIAGLQAEVEQARQWAQAAWHRLMWEVGHVEVERDEAHAQLMEEQAKVCEWDEKADTLQAQLRDAQEKATKYDQWFEKGRCPACHFEEKHMASCPVGVLEGSVVALTG